jgi:hypothetical protein
LRNTFLRVICKKYVKFLKQKKEMEKKFYFGSTLVVACPEFAAGSFMTMPSMRAESRDGSKVENISVVCVNCTTKAEIVPFFTNLLKKFQEAEKTDVVRNNIKFLEATLNQVAAGTFEHEPPKGLVEAISNASGMRLGKEQMLYLSGVTYIA